MTVPLTKSKLESVYRNEADVKVKERLLLVLKVKNDGMIPARAAKELHRSRTWASDWLKRYQEEGVVGLKDRLKSGRPTETTKQVRDIIFREGEVRYHYTHIYRILHKWGFKQKVPRKVHVNTASDKEKGDFKKEPRGYWIL